ncbi:Hypothetical_protein [Hexamita inflata]|uniref:Hypothetical_protein n=1 Tax=Hexamita inflata TaxID=28002 RepID=A0AA86R5L5_9EUKA|nr:Hypothetical protein HINF_LOCUS56968 [Hexamita inflata]
MDQMNALCRCKLLALHHQELPIRRPLVCERYSAVKTKLITGFDRRAYQTQLTSSINKTRTSCQHQWFMYLIKTFLQLSSNNTVKTGKTTPLEAHHHNRGWLCVHRLTI